MSDDIEVLESPLNELVLYLAKHAKYLTPDAQNAIAQYVSHQAIPIMKVKPSWDTSKVTTP